MRAQFFLSISLLSMISFPANAQRFKHVVVIIQENRTPDNLFGSNPTFEKGVDLSTTGVNSNNEIIPLTPVNLVGCYDIGHGYRGFLKAYNDGLMNGWDKEAITLAKGCKATPNQQFRYVDNSTGAVQPYFDLAKQYGWANRMFQTNQGASFPAHQFLFAGTSAPTENSPLFVADNPPGGTSDGCQSPPGAWVYTVDPNGVQGKTFPCFDHSTLVDVLEGAGLTWRYYTAGYQTIWNAPLAIKRLCNASGQTCTGGEWTNNVVLKPAQVLTDIQRCNLASVTWVTPAGQDSDHAVGNTGGGPSWVASIVNQIGTQPACPGGEIFWKDTAIFITWDDWGGWYDHVPPFRIGQSNGWGKSYVYGFRVPLIVVSAYTRLGYVDNIVHDFGSILRFVEANFNLGFIGPGIYADSYADDLMEFFPRRTARTFTSIKSQHSANHFIFSTEAMTDPDNE